MDIPNVTPEMEVRVAVLRASLAPEGFVWVTNAQTIPIDHDIASAPSMLRRLRRQYGSENVFAASAFNQACEPIPTAWAIYVREGAQTLGRRQQLAWWWLNGPGKKIRRGLP